MASRSGTSRSTFTARYSGKCDIGGERIEEGDQAAYVDDELACEECWEAYR